MLLYFARSIDPCDESLSTSFFIACGTIDLSCKEKIFYDFCLQGSLELGRREVVIFYGIAWAKELHLLETCYLAQGGILHLFWERGRKTIDIHFHCVPPFRFYKNLVTILIGKAVDLILYGRTIARPHTMDNSGEHGRAVKASP